MFDLWFVFRVFKGSDDVRLMRPASPESRSPDTNQGPARSVTPPTAAEPDTTQSGPSRETTEGLVTMMRCVCGLFPLICSYLRAYFIPTFIVCLAQDVATVFFPSGFPNP